MSSNKACCWILGIIAAGFALSVIVVAWGVSRAMSGAFSGEIGSSLSLKDNSWLVIEPSGTMSEYDVDPDLSFFDGHGTASLHDQLRAIKAAATDPHISGIILRPQGAVGFATLRELREALLDFKASNKKILAHLEIATDRDYYLASVADSIYMMPGRLSGLNFGGMAFSSTYLSKTFDKLGIQFHVIHAGRYKGAYEEFARDSMSAEMRESIEGLFADVYENYVRETVEARKNLTFAALDREIKEGDQLIVSGSSCVERGYVDRLVDWPVLRDRLKGENKEFEGVTPRELLRAQKLKDIPTKQNEVAVLFAQGEITFGGDGGGWSDEGITSTRLTKELEKLQHDEQVKAVVMRVNSPGGSALASKQILEAVKRLQESKPVIVSMGRVAASGGYYISASADKIVAEPNTLTGSIGVVSMIPSAEKLYEKIGAREETVSIGHWANFFRIDKTLGPEQEQVLRALMDSVYLEFREDVVAGRGVTMAALDTIAEGHIWTGQQALARGLVDTLGGLDEAIQIAARKAYLGQDEYDLGYYPKKKDLIEFIVDRFSTSLREFTVLGRDLSAAQNPERAIEYLKNYFNRFEFLQTVMPLRIDA